MWGHTAPAAGHRRTRVRKSESPFRATSVLSTEPSPWWAPLTSPLLCWVNVHFLFTFPTKQNSVTKTSNISFDMLDTIMRMKLFSILTLPHNLHMNQTCWEQLKSTGEKKKKRSRLLQFWKELPGRLSGKLHIFLSQLRDSAYIKRRFSESTFLFKTVTTKVKQTHCIKDCKQRSINRPWARVQAWGSYLQPWNNDQRNNHRAGQSRNQQELQSLGSRFL